MTNVTKGNASKVVERTLNYLNRVVKGQKIRQLVPIKGKPKEIGTYGGSGSFYDKKNVKVN